MTEKSPTMLVTEAASVQGAVMYLFSLAACRTSIFCSSPESLLELQRLCAGSSPMTSMEVCCGQRTGGCSVVASERGLPALPDKDHTLSRCARLYSSRAASRPLVAKRCPPCVVHFIRLDALLFGYIFFFLYRRDSWASSFNAACVVDLVLT